MQHAVHAVPVRAVVLSVGSITAAPFQSSPNCNPALSTSVVPDNVVSGKSPVHPV